MSRKTLISIVLAVILAVLAPQRAFSEPTPAEDIAAALQKARTAEAELKAAATSRDVYKSAYAAVQDDNDALNKVVKDRDGRILALQKRIDDDEQARVATWSWLMGAIAAACWVVALVAFVTESPRIALRAGIAAAASSAFTFAVAFYARSLGFYGFIGLGVASVGGVAWLIYEHRRRTSDLQSHADDLEAAGVEHANVLGLLERSNLVPAKMMARIRSFWYQETGHTADQLAAKALGVTTDELKQQADEATAVAAATA